VVHVVGSWCDAVDIPFSDGGSGPSRRCRVVLCLGEEGAPGLPEALPGWTTTCPPRDAVLSLLRAVSPLAVLPLVLHVSEEGHVEVQATASSAGAPGAGAPSATPREDEASLLRQASQAYDAGDFLLAAREFARLASAPYEDATAAYNLAAILHSFGLSLLAVPYFMKVILRSPEDRTAHSMLGGVLGELEPGAVTLAYREIVRRQPTNHRAAHRLACLTQSGRAAEEGRADPEYIREVFDEMAEQFETRLVHHLQYRAPWQLRDLVDEFLVASTEDPEAPTTPEHRLPGAGGWRIVDLGCGSGLCGRLFRHLTDPRAAPLPTDEAEIHQTLVALKGAVAREPHPSAGVRGVMTGVDLSSKMVDICREGGAYDTLVVGDANDCLASLATGSTSLVLSADTFIYIGDLERSFSLAAEALQPNGLFAFSLESMGRHEQQQVAEKRGWDGAQGLDAEIDEGFFLRASGRYAHAPGYVMRLARKFGFTVLRRKPITVRTETAVPIEGELLLLQRQSGSFSGQIQAAAASKG